MNAAKEWPKILGFADGSTVDEKAVDQHYRQRAKVLHPDVGGSVDDMQQLNLARGLALDWVERERHRLERPAAPVQSSYHQAQYTHSQYAAMSQNANHMGFANTAAQQQSVNSGGWLREVLGGMFR